MYLYVLRLMDVVCFYFSLRCSCSVVVMVRGSAPAVDLGVERLVVVVARPLLPRAGLAPCSQQSLREVAVICHRK